MEARQAEPGPGRQADPKACVQCGRRDAALLAVQEGFRIVRCPGCRLTYLDLEPGPGELEAFYSEGYFTGSADRKAYSDYEADHRLILRGFVPKLRRLERLARPGRILDVGCATGLFLEAARKRGWDPYGLEVSEYAAGIARRRLGGRVAAEASDLGLEPGDLSAATMWDSIEHLPDPAALVGEMHRLLAPGGVLALCTGDIDSWLARWQGMRSRIYNPPQHLFFFSFATLTALLQSQGFEVVERRNDGKWLSFGYFAHVISLTDPGPLTGLLGRLAQVSGVGRLPLWLPLPDNMQVYARKI